MYLCTTRRDLLEHQSFIICRPLLSLTLTETGVTCGSLKVSSILFRVHSNHFCILPLIVIIQIILDPCLTS